MLPASHLFVFPQRSSQTAFNHTALPEFRQILQIANRLIRREVDGGFEIMKRHSHCNRLFNVQRAFRDSKNSFGRFKANQLAGVSRLLR